MMSLGGFTWGGGVWPRPRRSLRNFYATQYTGPERVAVAQPVMRAAAGYAARTNSSWAPRGPRSRSRPSFRMRFKCANRIFALTSRLLKVFGASKRPGNVSGVFMDVARQRDGSFRQHWGMSGHTSQSSLLARNRSVFLRSVERRKLGLRLTSARRQNQSQLVSASSDRS
jgi:hypothetical protein